MIPVTTKAFLVVNDPDIPGFNVHLKYLLDDTQVKFFKCYNRVCKVMGFTDKKTIGDAKEIGPDSYEEALPAIDELIDLIIVGWSGKDKNGVEPIKFPKKPSSTLPIPDKFKMVELIMSNMQKLISLESDEVKN